MKIGELIKKYRLEHDNMSKGEFGRRSGYSTTYITLLESGVNTNGTPIKPTIECIKRVAKAMDTPFNDVLNQIDPETIRKNRDTEEREKTLEMTVEELKLSLNLLAQYKCRIPVLGRVAAGRGLAANEEIVDYIDVSEDESRSEDYFGLRISGDSMEPLIFDGDTVLIRKQECADDGSVIIALINGSDAVCKKLRRYNDKIGLISINPKYEPLYFTAEEQETIPVRILGRVMEVRRKL